MKKTIKTLALGASVLAMAGTANAATIDFNLYGSSAQFLFWTSIASSFLQGQGCTISHVATDSSGKHGITVGTNCTGGNTINMRYSSKASFDGVMAAKKVYYNDGTNTCGSSNPDQRPMADETSISGSTVGALKCERIHVGCSDVAGDSFTQVSTGNQTGPVNPNSNVITRAFTPAQVSTTGMKNAQPFVVPFGFYANNSVKVSKCVGGAHDGNLCTAATALADCGTGISCTAGTIDNISREQVNLIFSGNAAFWTDLGASYSVTGDSTNSIVACLRHAGSGTHSTLDYAVMNHGTWGDTLVSTESTANPIAYFNDGSSDEMKCINNNAGLSTTGAIGYSDADQSLSSYPNVVAIKYNGVPARRNTIRNGMYDFWTNEWLFENVGLAAGSAQDNLFTALVSYASNPANIPTAKQAYWATNAEMVYQKANDQVYPIYQGASNQMTP